MSHLPFSREDLTTSILPHDLQWFVRRAWPLVEPTNPLKWNWHLTEYCRVLQQCKEGKIKRLLVNVPPGTAKSLFFSVFFNAWVWSEDPSTRFLTFSYTDANTIRDNVRLRDIVRSSWYSSTFWSGDASHPTVSLASDQSAKIRFNTTAKGWRIASSVGGVGTGEHPNYIIIDDPLKAEDARSPTMRKACQDWMSSTVSTRQALDPTIIVVMQRLHEDDLTGFLLSKGGWEHLCFPMSFETERVDKDDPRNIPDPRDRRTQKGELLWPEVWTQEKVEQEELLLGLAASGQLQQRPVAEGGTLFQREWFEIVDSLPYAPFDRVNYDNDLELCRGWDIASTDENEAGAHNRDWTVGVKMGRSRSTGIVYILDVVRVRKILVDDLIKTTAKQDGIRCKVREGSGSGKATIKARSILLAGYDYEASPETVKEGDKVKRSNPFRSYCQNRNVKILRGPWNDVYLSVLCSFPVGKHDDDVDASSNAFNCLVVAETPVTYEITW